MTSIRHHLPATVRAAHGGSQTRFGFTPSINAVVTLIGVVSVVLIVVAARVLERQIDPYAAPPGAARPNTKERA